MAEPELLEQESVVAEHRGGIPRICVRRDRVTLEIAMVKPIDNSVLKWNARTVLPTRRTGWVSFVGTYGVSFSTERTGHPYEV